MGLGGANREKVGQGFVNNKNNNKAEAKPSTRWREKNAKPKS
jgi:hypothetical protein